MKRRTLLLAASMLVGLLLAATPPGPAETAGSVPLLASSEDDPYRDYIVAFHDLEAAGLEDGAWQEYPVRSVNPVLGFAVVEVTDPATFHTEDRYRENVRYVEWDDPSAFTTAFTPNDPRYDEQYGFPQIEAPAAWDAGLGDSGVTVAIVDTGIDQDHPDLQGTVAAQHDFVNDDGTANDACGHGTHVAGTVSANTDNGVGVAGTAGGVQLLVAKALSNSLLVQCTGSSSDIADAITWSTDQGADVISMSIGSTSESSTIGSAVEYAWSQGVVLFGAAGNDGQCSDCVSYPAAYPQVAAVTCTDSSEQQCSFSSQGPEAEVAAPGNDILSTYNDGGYTELSGTSMSTPHVSGVAGLMLSANQDLTNSEVRDLINQTAQDLGTSGHDNVFGHGEVDAAAAVDAAGGSSTNDAPTASFTTSCSGSTCDVDASGSSDADGSITSYDWDFGDGATGAGETTSHTYASGGTYTITLTVTDDDGATDSTSQEVTVSEANDAPTPSFTHDCTDLSCSFDASGSSDADGSITSYDWDFGDGATGTGETTSHSYDAGGTYTVTLTVTDDDGATDQASQAVEVTAPSSGPLFSEAFDDGVADAFTLTGLWHVSDACRTPSTTPNYLGYSQDSSCDYDTGATNSGTATFSADLSSVSTATLSFQHAWETESTSCGLISCSEYDTMAVEVSTDGGQSWSTLDSWSSLDANQPTFTSASYTLDSYTGQTAEIRFAFDTVDSANNGYPGWFVDDVEVTQG